MRLLCFAAFYLLAGVPGFAQTAANAGPGLPKDPRAIFEAAAPLYDFNSPELKPWHLKATYQLYDEKGKPTEQGTYEHWWASPKVYRSTWTRAGVSVSEWNTPEGTSLRKASGGPLRFFERALNSILLSPLPSHSPLDASRLKLELMMLPVGSEKLACVSSSLQGEPNNRVSAPSSARVDSYCFDPSTFALRTSYSNSFTREFNQIEKTQGRYLPRSLAISFGTQKVFSVSVEVVDGLMPNDAALVPPVDAVLEQRAASQGGSPGGDAVTNGELIKKVPPVYPFMARTRHQQGTVALEGVIGTDGRIHDLEVVASPSQRLTHSAVDAVKQWEYKPYLLNGKAVDVDTTVIINFDLIQ
jgi:TonB family protein